MDFLVCHSTSKGALLMQNDFLTTVLFKNESVEYRLLINANVISMTEARFSFLVYLLLFQLWNS